jgi:small-conductance mechanosensitive channel
MTPPLEIQALLAELAATSPRVWLWHGATMAGIALIAFGLRKPLLRFGDHYSHATADDLRAWPLGAGLAALLLWVGYALLVGAGMEAPPVRIAALVVAGWVAARVALLTIGATTFGWMAVAVIFAVVGVNAAGAGTHAVRALDAVAVEFGPIRISPWFAVKSIAIIVALFWLAQLIGNAIAKGLEREQALSASGQVLVAKLVRMGLLVLAGLFSLGALGIDFAALAVLSGAIGLGLGFGLQKVVSNYFAGLILLTDRSIKPGDVIEVEFANGQLRGEVTQLEGRYTTITQRTGVETLIPNEVLISNPVSNWSHTSRNVQIRIPIGIAYGADVERAIAVCIAAATATPRVLSDPAAVCLLMGFGASSIDLEVRYWIADSEMGVRNVSSAVYLEIWRRFRTEGIEIPFPQLDVHIKPQAGR